MRRAHVAEIEAHRVVAAPARLRLLGFGRNLADDLDEFALVFAAVAIAVVAVRLRGRLLRFALVLFDRVDAHLVQHREDILDALRGHLVRGQGRVDLAMRDEAALPPAPDHGLDGVIGHVEQRALVRVALVGAGCGQVTMAVAVIVVPIVRRRCGLAGHESPCLPRSAPSLPADVANSRSACERLKRADGDETSTRRHMRRMRRALLQVFARPVSATGPP